MERQLVVFTVGPVQSFIASARKIEDLWSGSYLLSHLIREALKELYREEDAFQLIFPVITKEEIEKPNQENIHIASLPNRFTAVMEGGTEQVIERLKATEHQVKKAFYHVGEMAIEKLFAKLNEEKRTRLINMTYKQIDALLEMYWVIEPYNGQPFQTVREKLESRLGALKNDKQYPQLEQQGLTCSVCNERDALSADPISETDRYRDMKSKLFSTWSQRDARFQRGTQRIKDNEFLCGICTGKRLARDYFQEYYQSPKSFPSFESIQEIAGVEQSYYGIFMIDGDNMGKWFSGDQIEDYSKVSGKLASFALETVPKIIKEDFPACRLVYAGGDDVLAFMPVDKALKAASRIRFAFSSDTEGLGEKATASAGLIIAHKKAPLQSLLNKVRKLEERAKKYQNPEIKETKNALALAVHTRSGEISESVLPWSLAGKQTEEILDKIIQSLNKELSSTFIYHFTAAFLPLLQHGKKTEYTKIASREMIEVELRRLVRRSADEQVSVERVEELVVQLIQLHDVVPTTLDFIFLLKMLTFFERKEQKV